MRIAARVSWLAVLAFSAWLTAPAFALHPFSASVDRFEIDGNAFGSADGAFDQVDEFLGGTLSPNWHILLGTASENGGFLTLRDPGVLITLVPGAPLEISNVENTTDVGDGEGDFTATSYWTGPPTGTNTQIHFQLYGIGATIEAAGLTFNNVDASGAGGGIPLGYSITQEVTFIGSGGGVPQSNTVPINPGDITGQLVLRMAFDDATNMMVCSFSLDGGATFQSPFPPLHVFQVVPSAEILLGADGIDVGGPPPPPPPPITQEPVATTKLLVKSGATPTGRKVSEQLVSPDNHIAVLPVFGATLNLRVGNVTQCFHLPQNYWRFRSNALVRYSDSKGLFSAVKSVKIHRLGSGTIAVKIGISGKHDTLYIVPPDGSGGGDTTLRLVGINAALEYCGSTAGGTLLFDTAQQFKVTGAPPPAACPLPGCSPSGAFLEDPGTAF